MSETSWQENVDKWLRPKVSNQAFLRLFPRNQIDFSSSPIPAYISASLAVSIAVKNSLAKPPTFKPEQVALKGFDAKIPPKTAQEHLQRMQYEVARLQAQKKALPAPLPYIFYGMIFGVCGTVLQSGDWNNGASTTTGKFMTGVLLIKQGWSLIYTMLNFVPTLKAYTGKADMRHRGFLPLAMAASCWCNLMIYGNRTWDYHFG
jgi:hypothetical protein